MKKLIFLVVLVIVVLFPDPNVCHAISFPTSEGNEPPWMGIMLRGYCDDSGRITVKETRAYVNRKKEHLKILDYVQIRANPVLDLVDFKITDKSDKIKIKEESDRLVISGTLDDVLTVVELQFEYLLPLEGRGANDRGEGFNTSFSLYNSSSTLPLKKCSVRFDFNQYADKYDKSYLSFKILNEDKTLEGIEEQLTAYRTLIPSITWEKENLSGVNWAVLHISYVMPSKYYYKLAWMIIMLLFLSNILLWILFIRNKSRRVAIDSFNNMGK